MSWSKSEWEPERSTKKEKKERNGGVWKKVKSKGMEESGRYILLDIFIKNILFILILIYVNWGNQLSLNVRYVDC